MQEPRTNVPYHTMIGAGILESKVLAEPVLVGRERELEELQHILDRAVEGKGNTVFISGEAGSGTQKTH